MRGGHGRMTIVSPYKIRGPACVNVSGGRTSMYMMRRILDEGPIDDGVFFAFANTGRELKETLDFVDECERQWGQKIYRLERRGTQDVQVMPSAFDRLLADKYEAYGRRGQTPVLPGPVARYCTIELKRTPAERFMVDMLGPCAEYDSVVGIRADEPSRVARLRERASESRPVYPDGDESWMHPECSVAEHKMRAASLPRVSYDYVLPLADDGVVEADVLKFWKSQPFDLELEVFEGNCDHCFMKSTWKRHECLRRRPALAEVWIADERKFGTPYRRSGQTVAEQLKAATVRLPLLDRMDDSLGDCLCHD